MRKSLTISPSSTSKILWHVACVAAIAFISPVARAACIELHSSSSLSVASCQAGLTHSSVMLRFLPGPKAIIAEFTEPTPHESASRRRFWNKLVVTDGENMLSHEEQTMLRSAQASLELNPESETNRQAVSLLDFLTGFVEPGERIPAFHQALIPTTWTMICDAIGHPGVGVFSLNWGPQSVTTIVGNPRSRCPGRCGAGCEQPAQWNKRQYTQECLNHDVCKARTGEQFGECEDEFWAAAAGYTLAPDCQ